MGFYEESLEIRERVRSLQKLVEQLSNTHLYRYAFFVENSELGEECVYAKKTKELSLKENEAERIATWLRMIN